MYNNVELEFIHDFFFAKIPVATYIVMLHKCHNVFHDNQIVKRAR